MEELQRVPALARVISAHVPLGRTPRTAIPSSKGGWEGTWLPFCCSSRTDLGRRPLLWIAYILLVPSALHPHIPSGARPSLQESFSLPQLFLPGCP